VCGEVAGFPGRGHLQTNVEVEHVERSITQDYKDILSILRSEVEQVDRRMNELYSKKRETTDYMRAITEHINKRDKQELRKQYTPLITSLKTIIDKIQEEIDSTSRYRRDLQEGIEKIEV